MWNYYDYDPSYYYQHQYSGDMMHVVPAANPVNSEGLLQHQPENNQLTACLSPEYSAPSSPFDFDIDFLINDAVGTVGQQQLQQPKQLTPASPVHHQDNSDADSGINLEGSGSQHCEGFGQVPHSPAFSLTDSVDSALSPAMFSPGSVGSGSSAGGSSKTASSEGQQMIQQLGTYEGQHGLNNKNTSSRQSQPSNHLQWPSSPYSPPTPGQRLPRRLSSTGSSSTGGLSLQDSLHEYDQVQQKVKLEQEMTQLNIPSSLMVTPVSCPPPPPGASAHTQHQTPAPPVVSMATITKVVAPPMPITQQLPPPAVSAITQPLLRQVLEQQRPILAPPPPPMFQNSPPPPQPVTIKQEAPSAAGGANDLVNQAMEQYRKDIEATCFKLGISQDPLNWSIDDVGHWMSFYQQQYNIVTPFRPFGLMDGKSISQMSEEQFSRMFPEKGQMMYSQLEIWRATASAQKPPPPPPAITTPNMTTPNLTATVKTEATSDDITSILDMLNDIQPDLPSTPPTTATQPSSLSLPIQPPISLPTQPLLLPPGTTTILPPSLTISPASTSYSPVLPPPPSYQETMSSGQFSTPSQPSLTISPVVAPKTTISFTPAATVTTLEQQQSSSLNFPPSLPPPAYPGQGTITNSDPLAVIKKEEDLDEDDEDEDEDCKGGSKKGGSNIMLWQFLKELLLQPDSYSGCIHWLDREKGVFKIVDSVRVAKLWGQRKNRPAMNYDKLSRSLRQYYKKGKMKKTEKTQRLVYQFCEPYHL